LSQESQSQGKVPLLGAAIGGGLVGAALMAAFLFLVAPQWLGPRIVRAGFLQQPEILIEGGEVLKERQYEPVLAANRSVHPGKARQSPTSPSPISTITPAAIAGAATRTSSGW
jgi:hypothetical protein